jgi:hypothetical protein
LLTVFVKIIEVSVFDNPRDYPSMFGFPLLAVSLSFVVFALLEYYCGNAFRNELAFVFLSAAALHVYVLPCLILRHPVRIGAEQRIGH